MTKYYQFTLLKDLRGTKRSSGRTAIFINNIRKTFQEPCLFFSICFCVKRKSYRLEYRRDGLNNESSAHPETKECYLQNERKRDFLLSVALLFIKSKSNVHFKKQSQSVVCIYLCCLVS